MLQNFKKEYDEKYLRKLCEWDEIEEFEKYPVFLKILLNLKFIWMLMSVQLEQDVSYFSALECEDMSENGTLEMGVNMEVKSYNSRKLREKIYILNDHIRKCWSDHKE